MADFGTVILPRMLVRFEAAKDALRRLGSSSTGDQSDAIVNNLFVNTVQDFVGVVPGAEAVYFDETTDNSITPVLTTPSAISTPPVNSTPPANSIYPAISTPQTISTRSPGSQTTDDCVRKRSLGEYLCNELSGDSSGGGHFHVSALTTGGHENGYDLMPEAGDDLQSPGGSKKPRLDDSYYYGCDGDGGDAYYCSSDHSKHGYGYHDAQARSASDRAASEDVFTISPDGISFGDDVSGQTGRGHVSSDVQVCDRMAKLSQRFGDGHQHGFGVFGSSGHSKHGDGNGGGQDGSSAPELLVSPDGSNNDDNNSEASEEEEIVDDDQLRVDDTSVGSSSPSNYQSLPQILDDSFGKKCGASREVTTAATSASYSATALNHSNEPISPTPSPNHFEASRSGEDVAQLDDAAFPLSVKGSPQFLSQFDLPESLLPLPSSSSSASLGASKKKNMKKKNNKRVITLTLDCMKKGCDLMSLNARDLTAHLWDNHNIGPYPCFVKGCGRTFYKKKHMDEHFLTSDKHLEDSRMICNYCLRVYQSHDGLKRHVIFHHQTGRFQCGRRAGGCGRGACRSVCSFVATTRMQVYWHYEKVHRRGRRGARANGQEDERIGMKEGGEAAARASEQNGSDVKLEV